MPPQTTRPPLRNAASAAGTSAPTGANRMAASSGSGGFSSEPPAHSAPIERAKAWPAASPGRREGEHPPSLPAADLGDDVPRGAEAIDADCPPVSGQLERAPADEARAKQRRRLDRIDVLGQREDEVGVRDRMGGVAAVAGKAGEQRRIAEVFASAPAIGAGPVGMAEPRDADARAELEAHALADRLDAADNLMSRHDGQLRIGQFAVDDVQVGATDAAGLDPDANLARSGRWVGPLLHAELFMHPMQDHGAHESDAPSGARATRRPIACKSA